MVMYVCVWVRVGILYMYVRVGPCGYSIYVRVCGSVGNEESDGFLKDTVAQSGCEGPTAAVTSSRWQRRGQLV